MRQWRQRRVSLRAGRRPYALGIATLILLAGCGPDYGHVANLDSGGKTIVCFGDSITRGHGAQIGRDYPARLSELLGTPVINAGVDGDTTGSALKRLEVDVLARDPRLVIVALGGNDLLRRVSKETTLSNLDRIVAACVNHGAMVALVHARFGLFSDPYLKGCEAITERHGAVLVRDALDDILGNPERMYDQIHPNDAGYYLLAQQVAEVVGPLLNEADLHRSRP